VLAENANHHGGTSSEWEENRLAVCGKTWKLGHDSHF